MLLITTAKLLFSLFLFSKEVFASPDNTPPTTLAELLREAENKNLELQQNHQQNLANQYSLDSKKAKFFPLFSIEGGPISNRLDHEEVSGNTYYFKTSWNFYNGGADLAEFKKIEAKSLFEKNKTLKLHKKINRQIESVYLDLILITENIRLKEQTLTLNENQKKISLAKKSAGLTLASDIVELELYESSLKSDLLRLKQRQIERSNEISTLLARTYDKIEQIFPSESLQPKKRLYNRAELIEKIKKSNAELNQAEHEIDLLTLETESQRAKGRPKLDFDAEYGRLASEERIFDESSNYKLNLKLTIPLFSGFENTNENHKLLAEAEKEKINYQQKLNLKISELDTLLNQIKISSDLLELEQTTQIQLQKYYQLIQNEYKRGLKSSSDIISATERIFNSKYQILEHIYELELSHLKILELIE